MLMIVLGKLSTIIAVRSDCCPVLSSNLISACLVNNIHVHLISNSMFVFATHLINSLFPCGAKWHRNGSIFIQTIVCCLMAASFYLNRYGPRLCKCLSHWPCPVFFNPHPPPLNPPTPNPTHPHTPPWPFFHPRLLLLQSPPRKNKPWFRLLCRATVINPTTSKWGLQLS